MQNVADKLSGKYQIGKRHPLSFCYRWAIVVVGTIFVGYAFYRILFPSVTLHQWWDRNILYGLSAVAAMLAAGFVLWMFFLLIDRLNQRHLKKAIIMLMVLACALCILCIALFSIAPAWDYGVLLRSALELSRDGVLTDPVYFSRYPFQIYPLLYLAFFMRLIHTQTMPVACGVSYVLNVVHILLAVYGAFLFGKISRNTRFGLKILLLCLFSIPLFLYAPICYTDTLALPFPIWTLLLWLYARRTPFVTRRQKIRKIALYIGSGLMAGLGLRIKSVAAIGLIALILFVLFDRTEQQKGTNVSAAFLCRPAIKKGITILLLLVGFLIAAAGTSLAAKAVGYGNLHDDRYTYPMTHWFMMGANRETIGGYYADDDQFTRSIPSYEEREKQTAARFKERIHMDGTAGYLRFLLDKLEMMLCTGNYQATGKLAQNPIFHHQALESYHSPLIKWYLACEQAFQSVILFSLIAGIFLLAWKPDGWIFRLSAMMLIGVVLFLLVWEGKARYLLFLIPVINIAAASGFSCVQERCLCLQKNLKWPKGHITKK